MLTGIKVVEIGEEVTSPSSFGSQVSRKVKICDNAGNYAYIYFNNKDNGHVALVVGKVSLFSTSGSWEMFLASPIHNDSCCLTLNFHINTLPDLSTFQHFDMYGLDVRESTVKEGNQYLQASAIFAAVPWGGKWSQTEEKAKKMNLAELHANWRDSVDHKIGQCIFKGAIGKWNKRLS